MRKIYLHIGCGKTGSSALQLWLHQSAAKLQAAGIAYPIYGDATVDDYAITSGNGVIAAREIEAGRGRAYFAGLASGSKGDILLSSETFQTLKEPHLAQLREDLDAAGLQPTIVAYVRDLYDVLYSSYLQLVKRHLYSKTFPEFVSGLQTIQQFQVVELWSAAFDDVVLVHYDAHKERLEKALCEVLGVDAGKIGGMKKNKVNRSLTQDEAELLRYLNGVYVNWNDKPLQAFSARISDALIKAQPEQATTIYYDERIEAELQERFDPAIAKLNRQYFDGQKGLVVFDKSGKDLVSKVAPVPDYFRVCMDALMTMVTEIAVGRETSVRRKGGVKTSLDVSDPRLVDALRDEAIRRERDDIGEAMALMRAAQILRPKGPAIARKMQQYLEALEKAG